MRYFLFFLIALSAFAVDDEVRKLTEETKARKEGLKLFYEKVSIGSYCQLRDYGCFVSALGKMPGTHPEDLIALRSIMEPFYLRSVKDGFPPCSEVCQNDLRAKHINLFSLILMTYDSKERKKFSINDTTTVKGTRFRAFMDLSAYGNIRKHVEYLKEEYKKLDLKKVSVKRIADPKIYEDAFRFLDSGRLFSDSILCHLHPGTYVYDEIVRKKSSKVDEKYREWMLEFDKNARSACTDSTPVQFRGMDASTRRYYERQTLASLKAIDCRKGDYACLRKHLRRMPIRYAKDVTLVSNYIENFLVKEIANGCDKTCRIENLLKASQTFITFLSQYDRKKLGSTMDWKKHPEEKYRTITEDVSMFDTISENFIGVLEALGKLDPAMI
jgi:hypothetical protein